MFLFVLLRTHVHEDSCHYDFATGRENEAAKSKDLGGEYVLASRHFAYYGNEAIPLPAGFDFMLPARYSRVNFSAEEEEAVGGLVAGLTLGLHGLPRDWRQGELVVPRAHQCE
jgi:hypothetical protein